VAELALEPLRSRRAVRRIREYDLFVIPGTGILDDFGQGPLDLPFHLLRWCRAARIAAVPVHFLSIGAEPVAVSTTRWVLGRAARLATYRSYRDHASLENAERLGIEVSGDAVYPDLAFSYPAAHLPPCDPVAWPPRRVGVGVMGYYGWNLTGAAAEAAYATYMSKLQRFVSWLLERGYEVRLLIGDTRPDQRPVRELVETLGAAAPRRDSAARLIAEPIRTVDDLLAQIAEVDVVVCSRLHNVVLALLLERPVISIGYSKKNDALLERAGFGDYCQDVESFDVDRLIRQFTDLASRPGNPAGRLRTLNDDCRRQLERQYAALLAELATRAAARARPAPPPGTAAPAGSPSPAARAR